MSAPPPAYYPPPGSDASGKNPYPPPGQAPYPPQQPYPGQQPYPQAPYPPQQPYPGQQPYPAPGYAPGPGQSSQQSTVIVTVPTVTIQHGNVSNVPMQTTCPNCHATVTTSIDYEVGGLTWLIFAILCFIGCWLCAFIPFCVNDCKDVVHTCPNCRAVIGRHRRL